MLGWSGQFGVSLVTCSRKVVETGVAHGVTSRFILEALERNGRGFLWSIDLPPLEKVGKSRSA